MNTFILSSVFLLHLFGRVYSFVQSYNYNHAILCSTSNTLDDIEELFVRTAKGLGYKFESKHYNCDLAETLKYSSKYSIVINFNVVNFGNVNDSIMNLLDNHHEDIILERYGKLNETINICDEENNQTDSFGRGCKDPDFNLKTKAFIGSVEKHGALYNIFKAITDNSDNIFRRNIVVCSDFCHFVDRDYEQFSIFCQSCDIEFECYENTIAIVVPSTEIVTKPCSEDIPVIFYDTLYIEPNSKEYTKFDYNASTMTLHWKALSNIINYYVIHKRKWERVAIVSDDSPLGKRLTNDQKIDFTRSNILFDIRYCSVIAEFNEALSLFNKFKIAVIIVNVAKENLPTVRRSAHSLGMTNKDIIWVFSGHDKEDVTNFKYASFINSKRSRDDYMDALKLVKNEYERYLGNETEFRRAIKNYIPPKTYDYNRRQIVEIPSNLGTLQAPYLGCTMRANDFYFPCRDIPILYIILALLIFSILVLVILVFFNCIKINTLEYRPLHNPPSIWSRIFGTAKPREQRYPMIPFRRRY